MDITKFSTIGYFIKSYFNWSMDWSELENCIEEFLIREQVETVEALKKGNFKKRKWKSCID